MNEKVTIISQAKGKVCPFLSVYNKSGVSLNIDRWKTCIFYGV